MTKTEARHTFARWAAGNALVYLLAFLTVTILAKLSPTPTANIATAWFSVVKATGIRQVTEFSVRYDAFVHVLQRNTLSTFLQLLSGSLGVAPISLGVLGAFYGLVVFAKPLSGTSLSTIDASLIISEGLAFILAASLSSTISSYMFGIEPGFGKVWFRSLLKASRSNFRTNQGWRPTLMKYAWLIASVSSIIVLSLLTGAWIEAVSY